MVNAENYETKFIIAPWVNGEVAVSPSDLRRLKRFLLRNSLISAEIDTYDTGVLFVCVQGTGTGLLGELYLDFEVDFFSPIPSALNTIPVPDTNSFFVQTAPLPVPNTGAVTVIPWDTVQANPIGLVPIAGVFTGLRGALVVYAQATVLPSAALTAGNISIELQTASGGPWNVVQQAGFTIGATTYTTQNLEFILQLLPTYSFRITLRIATSAGSGTSTAFPNGPTNGVLVLTPA